MYSRPLCDVMLKYGISYHMCADDSQLYIDFSSCDEKTAMANLQLCIQEIKTWLRDNFLLLNEQKTEVVKFGREFTGNHLQIGEASICSIILYLSVIRGEEEIQNNQMIKKETKKKILKSDEDEAVFLLGDFNGHTGTIGEQQQNYNGKLLMDLIIECNITMLNDTDKCTGINTWSRGDQKSTIDFVLVNNKGYQTCEWMEIDETQDVFDLSDHNLIDIELKLNTIHHRFDKKYQWIEKECYNFDERSTDLYIRKLEETMENGNVNTIEEFNMMIEDASNQTLKRSYKQRIIMNNDKIIAKEPPWINAQIRSGIKKRK